MFSIVFFHQKLLALEPLAHHFINLINTVCLYPEPGVHRVQDTGSQLYIEAGSPVHWRLRYRLANPAQSGTSLYKLDMGSL
ncbi:hypothetical protein [uncultured Alistipes sp.]|jgi:hypothetical protein|uniref:hypothetical protein n=1 Tax=uncultured Alistipes sp. TaxID=538949 RepID=UPI00260B4FE4|nr:hypothetical protein [uncultured Alistipes sp.]